MNKKIMVTLIAVALLLSCATIVFRLIRGDSIPVSDQTPSPHGEIDIIPRGSRTAAPSLPLQDREGNALALSDLFGRPAVLNFWASYCGPCKSEMPDFQRMFEQYGDDVTFVMVDIINDRETREDGEAYIDGAGYTFPVYFDTDRTSPGAFGFDSIPATFFLDAEGRIAARHNQSLDADALERVILALLTEDDAVS